MKLQFEKSGQIKKKRKSFSTRYHELLDKFSNHFSTMFLGRLRNAREVRLWVTEWALLVIVVFLFALVQIFWYGDDYEIDAFVAGGEFSEATLGKVNSMNPLYAATSSEKTLSKLLFANLVAPDVSGKMKGELAKSVKMDETGKEWTVTLRDNIFWSDGEPITADDVKLTVELIANPVAKTTLPMSFSNVKVEKVDEKTVKFLLPSVYLDFMDSLEFPVVPAHVLKDVSPALLYENDFSKSPVCSGPFVLNAMQAAIATERNVQTIYLNANDNYFLSDALISNFTLKTYESTDDIFDGLRDAEVMATAELSAEALNDLPQNINGRSSAINGGVFAFMNTESENINNVKVRQAIQRGVDMEKVREDISDSFWLDYPILAEQADLKFPELPKYDLEAAKKLLVDAGYTYKEDALMGKNGKRATIAVSVVKRDPIADMAERYVDEIKKLGFEVVLSIYDETEMSSDFFATVIRPRDYDILIYEVDLGVSADPFVFYSSTQADGVGWNFSNYSNDLIDDTLLRARTTTSKELRKSKYEYFLQTWVNEVPAVGIYRSSLNYYYARNHRVYAEDLVMTDALDRFADVRFWASEKRTVNMTP